MNYNVGDKVTIYSYPGHPEGIVREIDEEEGRVFVEIEGVATFPLNPEVDLVESPEPAPTHDAHLSESPYEM